MTRIPRESTSLRCATKGARRHAITARLSRKGSALDNIDYKGLRDYIEGVRTSICARPIVGPMKLVSVGWPEWPNARTAFSMRRCSCRVHTRCHGEKLASEMFLCETK